MQRLQIIVQGRVQGVGFRWFAKDKAESLSIKGWVKNLQNGDVEIDAEGTTPEMNEFLSSVRKGPWGAYVSNVHITELTPEGKIQGFEIIR